MKFVFYTDAHLTGQNPSNRTDVYYKSILDKISQIYNYAKGIDADFVLFGGDLCNTHKIYSYYVLEKFISIIKDSGIPTFFVVGQHDLYGYEKSSYGDSALCFIEKMSDSMFVRIEDKLNLNDCLDLKYDKKIDIDCCLYSSHSYDNYLDRLGSVEDNKKFNILLMHELLTNKDCPFEVIKTSELKSNADLILSGDLHEGYDIHKIGKTTFYNSGSISRIKKSDRALKFSHFDVKKNKDEYSLELKEVPLEYLPSHIIFKDEEVFEATDYSGFVSEIDTIEADALDIFDLLQKVSKPHETKKEMINYILKFRKSVSI